jgi:5-methylcytosine-specific restriction endonuclease McrA
MSEPRNKSCACGECRKCYNRIRLAAYRASNPEYVSRARDSAKAKYQELSAEARRERSAKRAEYQRKYKQANRERIADLNAKRRTENREHVRAVAREYYRNNSDTIKARAKASHAANPEAALERAKAWAKENPDRLRVHKKKWAGKQPPKYFRESCRRYRERYPDLHRARLAAWKKQNPEKNREYVANRRARTVGSGGRITSRQIDALYAKQQGKCAGCRKAVRANFQLDHVMPLALGGEHSIENAQILCPKCNRSKHAKHPDAWAASIGRLFA